MIELLDKDLRLLRPLDSAIRCGYKLPLNDMPTADLILAVQDPANAEIVVPASWLRIADGDEFVGLFRFQSIGDERHQDRGMTAYKLEGAQCTLLDDLLAIMSWAVRD